MRAVGAGAMLVTSACAALTGTRGGRAPNARHVDAAREQLGDAMAAGSIDSVARLLADSVVVRVPGRAVVGRDSVAAFLLANDGPLPMTAEPSFADVCSAGARDVGTVATRDERLYAYEVDWTESAGGARVASFRFGDVSSAGPPDLARHRIGCADEWPSVRYYQRPVEIFALYSPTRGVGATYDADLKSAIVAQGWVPQVCLASDPTVICPRRLYPPTARRGGALILGAYARRWTHAGVELVAGGLGSTVSAARPPQSYYWVARAVHDPRFAAVLATADLGFLRFGAGPAIARDQWRWGLVNRFTDALNDGLDRWTDTAPGAVVEASAALPIGFGEAVQLRWQAGRFGRQHVRAFDGLGPMTVRSGYQLLGIAIALRP